MDILPQEDFERVHKTKLDDQSHQAIMLTICERCILGSAVKVATTCKTALEQGKDPELLGFAGRKKKREAEARLAAEKKRREEEEEARKLEGASRALQPEVEEGSGERERVENGLGTAEVAEKQEGDEEERERERRKEEEREDRQIVSTGQENHEQDQPTPSVASTSQNGEEAVVERASEDRGQAEERHEENGEKENEEEEEEVGEEEVGEEESGGGEEEKDTSSQAAAPSECPAEIEKEETDSAGNG